MQFPRILWIEEEVNDNLIEFKNRLSSEGYLINVVLNASEAELALQSDQRYDLIILDIRIEPGVNDRWVLMHTKDNRRLGLKLLEEIPDKYKNKLLIFTNENWRDVAEQVKKCGYEFSNFLEKKSAKRPGDLLEVIKKYPGMKIEFI